ncbi:MAG: hypothetical protein ACP5IA_09980 [Sediminispirochaetaceae bacterium]
MKQAPGRAAVRIIASGEKWLCLEAGFDAGDHFIHIENIEARGIAAAGTYAFVLALVPAYVRTGRLPGR